ncbi:putative ATPase [Pedobacter cryoconitis]|uniref:Putative ATPase n=1 Tax=Pedobacter cryoconitis TaxID=188932 RepID=A0A7W8ZQ45_9SPHI|nr:AAA family ATPase [Pedobacter cryoconitis]MBB5638119.1 putative ATPase [Pedobacter cryoconitis]
MNHTNLLSVITGGPGSGKTTLINALNSHGIKTTAESGRKIIQDQVSGNGNALPWLDPAAFAGLMFNLEKLEYYKAIEANEVIIFDRGIPDVTGYLRLMNLPVPGYMDYAARNLRYNRKVFIAPPWPEIFERDAERKQTFEEALQTFEFMFETYSSYGYTLIILPLVSVEERTAFVLEKLDYSI